MNEMRHREEEEEANVLASRAYYRLKIRQIIIVLQHL